MLTFLPGINIFLWIVSLRLRQPQSQGQTNYIFVPLGVQPKFFGRGQGWWVGREDNSEKCLKWGGGGHQEIFPKTSQNRG